MQNTEKRPLRQPLNRSAAKYVRRPHLGTPNCENTKEKYEDSDLRRPYTAEPKKSTVGESVRKEHPENTCPLSQKTNNKSSMPDQQNSNQCTIEKKSQNIEQTQGSEINQDSNANENTWTVKLNRQAKEEWKSIEQKLQKAQEATVSARALLEGSHRLVKEFLDTYGEHGQEFTAFWDDQIGDHKAWLAAGDLEVQRRRKIREQQRRDEAKKAKDEAAQQTKSKAEEKIKRNEGGKQTKIEAKQKTKQDEGGKQTKIEAEEKTKQGEKPGCCQEPEKKKRLRFCNVCRHPGVKKAQKCPNKDNHFKFRN